ncbi:hypothetical protein [Shigella flexneri]|uniref:hypothetical protein n=1 Tax=Shigella flexneri TaxID=623 RepID=UPI003CEC8E37
MVTGLRDRGAESVAKPARRPLAAGGRGKGGFAALVVTNASNLVDLFVTISFFGMVTPGSWPGRRAVTKGD